MQLKFELGEKEKTILLIERNWFTGKFIYSENGIQNNLKSPLNPSTHFDMKLSHNYEFEVGNEEKHKIEIKHTRPQLFAGFRPQLFEIKINGEIYEKYKGY